MVYKIWSIQHTQKCIDSLGFHWFIATEWRRKQRNEKSPQLLLKIKFSESAWQKNLLNECKWGKKPSPNTLTESSTTAGSAFWRPQHRKEHWKTIKELECLIPQVKANKETRAMQITTLTKYSILCHPFYEISLPNLHIPSLHSLLNHTKHNFTSPLVETNWSEVKENEM